MIRLFSEEREGDGWIRCGRGDGSEAFAFVPLYRSLNSVSAYAFLVKRFGAWARMYGSACFLVMQTARSGVVLYLLALLLKTLFGWSIPLTILVVGLATCVYSMLGGVLAVIWTDAMR